VEDCVQVRWLWVLLTFATSLAHAQEGSSDEGSSADERARVHFQSATVYFEAGRYEQAAEAFLESYRLSNRPELLQNAATAYERALLFDRAIEVTERMIQEHPDFREEALLRERIAHLTRLRDRVGGAPAAAAAPGPWIPGFAIAGAGAAVAIVGFVLGGVALGESDAIAAQCPSLADCDQSLRGPYDAMRLMAGASDVLWVTGTIIAATGVVLAFVIQEGGETAAPSVSGGCGADGCLVAVSGSFE
jgi:tetratricopeptide (TPR) repeat protein